MAEFDLIERIRSRALAREDVVLGIGDDAALLQGPADRQLVVAMDTLNEGVHFPVGTAAADIGWKALAVNLSDLAAMGAEPAWCTLSLSLPDARAAWVDAFIDGFQQLAVQHRVALVGGDTTRGPRSVCVTVHGFVEPHRALRRDAAQAGDALWVSGTLGEAAAALALCSEGASAHPDPGEGARWRARLDRPTPRIELGRALRGIASACIDVSDGLLADLGHVCRASGVRARVDVDALPGRDALLARFDREAARRLQAAGGDDYELCFTAPAAMAGCVATCAADAGVPVTCIGQMTAGSGVEARDGAGRPWQPPRTGYQHFGA